MSFDTDTYKDIRYVNPFARAGNYLTDINLGDYYGEKSRPSATVLMELVKDYIHNGRHGWSFRNQTLYVSGEYGTQKTTMIKALCMNIAYVGYLKGDVERIRYYTMNELKNIVQNDYYRNSEEHNDDFYDLEESSIVVVDESFDINRVSLQKQGHDMTILESWFKRWIGYKTFIFISNVGVNEIDRKSFGEGFVNMIERETLNKGNVLTFDDVYRKELIDVTSIFQRYRTEN